MQFSSFILAQLMAPQNVLVLSAISSKTSPWEHAPPPPPNMACVIQPYKYILHIICIQIKVIR